MLSLSRSTLVEDYLHHWEDDPAFDQGAPMFKAEYRKAKESGDWSKVPRKEGAPEPTGFKLRHLRGKVMRHAKDVIGSKAQYTAFRELAALALVGVKGLTDPATGEDYVVSRVRHPVTGLEVASDEDMDALEEFADGALIDSIGMRVIEEMGLLKN